MATPYTRRQGQFLAYIQTYIHLHGRAPAEAEMAAHFGVSPPSAHQMVLTLERHGLIERTPGQARSLRVLLPIEAVPALDSGEPPRQEPAFEQTYPHLARWIMGSGWVELGSTEGSRSLARALDDGGMVWEGRESYSSLDELLRDLNEGIAQWISENT